MNNIWIYKTAREEIMHPMTNELKNMFKITLMYK